MVHEKQRPDGTIELVEVTGIFELEQLAPGLVKTRLIGYGSRALIAALLNHVARLFESAERCVLFVDASALDGFDTHAHAQFTEWTAASGARMERIVVWTPSGAVRVAAGQVSSVIGERIRAHRDPAGFNADLEAELERRRNP